MASMAEVEVDTETGEIKLVDFVSCVDCGTPINPALVKIQVEGGVAQGIGMALSLIESPFLDKSQLLGVDTVGVIDSSGGVRESDDLRTELGRLLGGILGNVSGTGNHSNFALKFDTAGLEHFAGEVDAAVTGGLRTDETSAPVDSFTGEDAVIAVDDLLVLTEHVSDLAGTDTDVTGGNVDGRTDVAVELSHQALAEAHDFAVAFAFGIEIAAAFASAHGQSGEAVFEDLLKSEELEDAEVHGGVETHSAFVGADRAVELDTVSGVDLDVALVIDPRNLEDDGALRNDHALENSVFLVLRLGIQQFGKGREHFSCALDELFLRTVGLGKSVEDSLYITVHDNCLSVFFSGGRKTVFPALCRQSNNFII